MVTKTKEKQKQISTTNMVEKIPQGDKAPANVTGTLGAALASTLIVDTENFAKTQATFEKVNLKGTLGRLMTLGRDDHLAFRKGWDDEIVKIGNLAVAQSMSTTDFVKANSDWNYVYIQASEWKRLSMAVEKGWTPNLNLSWSDIKKAATEVANSSGTANPELVAKLIEIRRNDDLPLEQKAEMAAELVKVINESIVPKKAGPTERTDSKPNQSASGAAVAPANGSVPLFQVILPLLRGRKLEEVKEIVPQLAEYIRQREIAEKQEAEKAEKAAELAKQAVIDPNSGRIIAKARKEADGMAPASDKPTHHKEEAATAKGKAAKGGKGGKRK